MDSFTTVNNATIWTIHQNYLPFEYQWSWKNLGAFGPNICQVRENAALTWGFQSFIHDEFQTLQGYFEGGLYPYISRIHRAYIGWNSSLKRCLKCLVIYKLVTWDHLAQVGKKTRATSAGKITKSLLWSWRPNKMLTQADCDCLAIVLHPYHQRNEPLIHQMTAFLKNGIQKKGQKHLSVSSFQQKTTTKKTKTQINKNTSQLFYAFYKTSNRNHPCIGLLNNSSTPQNRDVLDPGRRHRFCHDDILLLCTIEVHHWPDSTWVLPKGPHVRMSRWKLGSMVCKLVTTYWKNRIYWGLKPT